MRDVDRERSNAMRRQVLGHVQLVYASKFPLWPAMEVKVTDSNNRARNTEMVSTVQDLNFYSDANVTVDFSG